MNKSQLVDNISGAAGGRVAAAAAVDALFSCIQQTVVAGERVVITGFGVFERVDRAPRTGRNPRTREAVAIDATSVARFRPGVDFKSAIEGSKPITVPASRGAADNGVSASNGKASNGKAANGKAANGKAPQGAASDGPGAHGAGLSNGAASKQNGQRPAARSKKTSA